MSVIHSTGSFLPIGSEALAEFPAQDRSRSPPPESPSAIEFDALGYLAPEASGPSKSEKDSSQVHMSLELPHTQPHAIYVGPPHRRWREYLSLWLRGGAGGGAMNAGASSWW